MHFAVTHHGIEHKTGTHRAKNVKETCKSKAKNNNKKVRNYLTTRSDETKMSIALTCLFLRYSGVLAYDYILNISFPLGNI